MWKYRHFVKENPKSGYDWSATGQRQTALSVYVDENTENVKDLVLSQDDNQKTHRLNREINWHSLTDCRQNNLSWSPAQLCQTTSRTATVWYQSRRLSDSLQAAAVRGSLTSYGLEMKIVYRRTTMYHSTRRTIGFMHQLITGSDTSIPAVSYACRLWCPLPCHKWVWLNW